MNLFRKSAAFLLTAAIGLAALPAHAGSSLYFSVADPGNEPASGNRVCNGADGLDPVVSWTSFASGLTSAIQAGACGEEEGQQIMGLSASALQYLQRKQAAGAKFKVDVSVKNETNILGLAMAGAGGTLSVSDGSGTIGTVDIDTAWPERGIVTYSFDLPATVDLGTIYVEYDGYIIICCLGGTVFDQASAASYLAGAPRISW